jgi:EmrB/QacA subfamily drug resistance transporter
MRIQTIALTMKKELPKGMVLFTFLLGIFVGALDNGIVGPALSSIINHFELSQSWAVWSFTVYTLFFAVSIPIMAKFSDRFGRKKIYAIGIILFAIGSMLAAIAPTFTFFLIGRAIQAIGTGGIFPITSAQIAATYPPEKRGKFLGYIGVIFGLGTILGPVSGAAIISFFPWQWIFLINIPISIVILLLLTQFKQSQELVKKPIDVKGIFLLTATILALMSGITLENIYLLALGILLFITMIPIEKKAIDPVLNLKYMTQKNTLVIFILSLTSGFIMATTINLLPLYSEITLGLTKGQSGMGVTPLAIASMIASLFGGALVDKIGAKKVLMVGFVLTVIGALSLAFFVTNVPMLLMTIVLMGFGIGIIIGAPLNIMIMQYVELKDTGSAVGYLSLFRSLGSTIGPTIAGIILAGLNNHFTLVYTITLVLASLSLVLIISMKNKTV